MIRGSGGAFLTDIRKDSNFVRECMILMLIMLQTKVHFHFRLENFLVASRLSSKIAAGLVNIQSFGDVVIK